MEAIIVLLIIFIIFEIPTSFGWGLIFKKTNLEFNKGIIPFYNKIILIKKYNLPQYHLILIFIPIIGLYTNFKIYTILAQKYNKPFIYILELTIMPFIYNIFLGLELKQNTKEEIENYFEDQKEIYEQKETKEEKEKKDEYIWIPKQKIKSDTIYKASRNKINTKVNLNIQKDNEIIDKKQKNKKENINKITCPKCGTELPENTKICFVCGTKT